MLLMMMMMVCGVGGVDDGDVDGGDDVVDDGGGDDDDGDDVEGQDGLWKREKDNSLDHNWVVRGAALYCYTGHVSWRDPRRAVGPTNFH